MDEEQDVLSIVIAGELKEVKIPYSRMKLIESNLKKNSVQILQSIADLSTEQLFMILQFATGASLDAIIDDYDYDKLNMQQIIAAVSAALLRNFLGASLAREQLQKEMLKQSKILAG